MNDAVRWLEKQFDMIWEMGGFTEYIEEGNYVWYTIAWHNVPEEMRPFTDNRTPPLMIMLKVDN